MAGIAHYEVINRARKRLLKLFPSVRINEAVRLSQSDISLRLFMDILAQSITVRTAADSYFVICFDLVFTGLVLSCLDSVLPCIAL